MKRSVKTLYQFDDKDAQCHARDVDEAFNRMAIFAPEVYEPEQPGQKQHPARRAFNVVIDSGAAFERMDVEILRDYAVTVVKRAKQKVAEGYAMLKMLESVRHQAADHLTVTLGNLAMALDACDKEANPRCSSCLYMRERRRTDVKVEAGYGHAMHWCVAIDMPTVPAALRCGGNDYRAKA